MIPKILRTIIPLILFLILISPSFANLNVSINLTANKNSTYFKDNIKYTIYIKNNGSEVIKNLTADLSGLGIDSKSFNATITKGNIDILDQYTPEWKIGDLNPGETVVANIEGIVDFIGEYNATVAVTNDYNNYIESEPLLIVSKPVNVDLSISLIPNSTCVHWGDYIKILVKVRNNGPDDADKVLAMLVTYPDYVGLGINATAGNAGKFYDDFTLRWYVYVWDVGRVKSNEEKVAEVTIKAVNFNEDQIISNFTVIGYVYIDDWWYYIPFPWENLLNDEDVTSILQEDYESGYYNDCMDRNLINNYDKFKVTILEPEKVIPLTEEEKNIKRSYEWSQGFSCPSFILGGLATAYRPDLLWYPVPTYGSNNTTVLVATELPTDIETSTGSPNELIDKLLENAPEIPYIPLNTEIIIVSNFSVVPTSGNAPLKINVSCCVSNHGNKEGIYRAELKINNNVVDVKEVKVGAGECKNITFIYTLDKPGTYNVTIGNFPETKVKVEIPQKGQLSVPILPQIPENTIILNPISIQPSIQDKELGTYNVTIGTNVTDVLPPVTVTVTTPANFTLSNLTVTPTSGVAPLTITATAKVTNTGGTAGNYTAVLYINGSAVANQTVTLGPGNSTTVSLSYTLTQAGTYNVTIGNLTPVTVNVTTPVVPTPTPVVQNKTFSIILKNTGTSAITFKYYISVYTNPVNGTKVYYKELTITLKPNETKTIELGKYPEIYAVSTTILIDNKRIKKLILELKYCIEGLNPQTIILNKNAKSGFKYVSRFTGRNGYVDSWFNEIYFRNINRQMGYYNYTVEEIPTDKALLELIPIIGTNICNSVVIAPKTIMFDIVNPSNYILNLRIKIKPESVNSKNTRGIKSKNTITGSLDTSKTLLFDDLTLNPGQRIVGKFYVKEPGIYKIMLERLCYKNTKTKEKVSYNIPNAYQWVGTIIGIKNPTDQFVVQSNAEKYLNISLSSNIEDIIRGKLLNDTFKVPLDSDYKYVGVTVIAPVFINLFPKCCWLCVGVVSFVINDKLVPIAVLFNNDTFSQLINENTDIKIIKNILYKTYCALIDLLPDYLNNYYIDYDKIDYTIHTISTNDNEERLLKSIIYSMLDKFLFITMEVDEPLKIYHFTEYGLTNPFSQYEENRITIIPAIFCNGCYRNLNISFIGPAVRNHIYSNEQQNITIITVENYGSKFILSYSKDQKCYIYKTKDGKICKLKTNKYLGDKIELTLKEVLEDSEYCAAMTYTIVKEKVKDDILKKHIKYYEKNYKYKGLYGPLMACYGQFLEGLCFFYCHDYRAEEIAKDVNVTWTRVKPAVVLSCDIPGHISSFTLASDHNLGIEAKGDFDNIRRFNAARTGIINYLEVLIHSSLFDINITEQEAPIINVARAIFDNSTTTYIYTDNNTFAIITDFYDYKSFVVFDNQTGIIRDLLLKPLPIRVCGLYCFYFQQAMLAYDLAKELTNTSSKIRKIIDDVGHRTKLITICEPKFWAEIACGILIQIGAGVIFANLPVGVGLIVAGAFADALLKEPWKDPESATYWFLDLIFSGIPTGNLGQIAKTLTLSGVVERTTYYTSYGLTVDVLKYKLENEGIKVYLGIIDRNLEEKEVPQFIKDLNSMFKSEGVEVISVLHLKFEKKVGFIATSWKPWAENIGISAVEAYCEQWIEPYPEPIIGPPVCKVWRIIYKTFKSF